jgi:aminoglycoside phosphotransferase family enzyme
VVGVRGATCGAVDDLVTFLHHDAWPALEPEVVETHMSLVFLAGDLVYKLKKPVELPFLDFRTLEARRVDCEAEVRLNRALAPGVYLGTLPVVRTATGQLALGGCGEPVDWLVVMRRLDREKLLDQRLARGAVPLPGIRALLDVLAAFYRATPRRPDDPTHHRRRLHELISRDEGELLRPSYELDRDRIRWLCRRQRAVVDRLDELRHRATLLVDGHGDLRPEHVLLDGRPLILDRLTFDPELRRVDPLFDVALLSVECGYLGRPLLGEAITRGLQARTSDHATPALTELYCSLRAASRARLSIAHLRDGAPDRSRWTSRTSAYLALAERHIEMVYDAPRAG